MASSRSQEIRVGIVTVIGLVILVGGIMWGTQIGFGVDQRTITMIFPSAAGVEFGTPVNLYGVRKGSVISLEAVPEGARVVALIDASTPLHADATASIQMLEITGGKKIELNAGKSQAQLAESAVIIGQTEGDVGSLIAVADKLGADIQHLLGKVDTALTAVSAIITDPSFAPSVQNTLSNLEGASADLKQIAAQNKDLIKKTISGFNQLSVDLQAFVEKTGPSIERTAGAAEETLADAKIAIRTLNETAISADTLIRKLDGIAADIRDGNGTVSKLIYDEEFAKEVEETLAKAKALIEEIEKYGINTNVRLGRYP